MCASAIAQTDDNAHFNPKPFGLWLQEFKQEALSQGISAETLEEAFASTQLIDRIIELDRKQPETMQTLDEYLTNVVTDARADLGREMMVTHRDILTRIGREYGVQPRFIVALWGIETNFGGYTGNYSTVDALATLAYDGRRSEFFRGELLKALRISQDDRIPPSEIYGSWAGAMGQCQFMPSSFLNFAVDYDRDGKRDIWNTLPDVFASIANYLQESGWDGQEGWGMKVSLPPGFNEPSTDINDAKLLSHWQRQGVRLKDGSDLPPDAIKASLIVIGEGDDARPYLVTNNYKVLLKWNRSRYFATAVGMLADFVE